MIATQRHEAVEISVKPEASNESLPGWISAIAMVGALLMGAGAVIALVRPAMLVAPNAEITSAVRVYAGYLVSRNLALALMLIVMLAMRARGVLGGLMVLTAFIQLFDAGMDALEGRWAIVPGVSLFAIVFFLGAARLNVRPLWKVAAWRNPA